MRTLRILTAALILAAFTAGGLFAQSQGRVEWFARARTDLQLNFSENRLNAQDEEIEFPGIAFYDDNDGGAYSWETYAELLMWYGKDLTSMWTILTYRQGWGFETKFNLSYDNNRSGNTGGKVQIGSRWDTGAGNGFSLMRINRLSMYGWYQAWDKKVLMEINPFGATEEEWGSIWKTPAWLFDDRDIVENTGLIGEGAAFYDGNLDAFYRIQFRNVIDNLSFGIALPNFGELNSLNWDYYTKNVDGVSKYWEASDLFMRASLGFRYTGFDLAFAGGFKMDPDKAQRAYLGGEYKLMNQSLGIRADFKLLNLGGMSENITDLDMAQGVTYSSGPMYLQFSLYERNLLWNENKNIEIKPEFRGRYTIIPRRLLTQLIASFDIGVGEENDNYRKLELEPGLFWAMGSQGVSTDLDHYSGMYTAFNMQFGTNPDDSKIAERKLYVGFRWSM